MWKHLPKLAGISGIVILLVAAAAAFANHRAGTLMQGPNASAVGVMSILGAVLVALGTLPAVANNPIFQFIANVFRQLNAITPPQPVPPVQGMPMAASVVVNKGQYMLDTPQQRDFEALNHLATRAALCANDPKQRTAMLELCTKLQTAFFEIHHGVQTGANDVAKTNTPN